MSFSVRKVSNEFASAVLNGCPVCCSIACQKVPIGEESHDGRNPYAAQHISSLEFPSPETERTMHATIYGAL